MKKIRHWFWHIVAMATVCDLSIPEVSDYEWKQYKTFMQTHGFNRVP